MQVNVIAWDFTKLLLVPFLITAKASKKAGIITVLISAIYKLFPSPNLTIIIIVIIFLQSSMHAKQKQDQNFALILTLSLCSCSCKIASYSPSGQTLLNPKLFPLWFIISLFLL